MIISFFSHKGGVGRTMALANIAYLLFQKGQKVIMMDWDFESPGLECFFGLNKNDLISQPGMSDLMNEFISLNKNNSEKKRIKYPNIEDYLYPIDNSSGSTAQLSLIHPGKRFSQKDMNKFVQFLLSFQFVSFYNDHSVNFFDWLSKELTCLSDVILIDSRTGFSETAGIGNFHMSDVVILFSSTSAQNYQGLKYIIEKLKQPELIKNRNNRPIETILVPARYEPFESEMLSKFEKEFYDTFKDHLPEQFKAGKKPEDKVLLDLGIPYVPYYSYGDQIAVKEGIETSKNKDLWHAYHKLLDRIERCYYNDLFIYYEKNDKDTCQLLVTELKKHRIKIWVDYENIVSSDERLVNINKALKTSRYYLILFSQSYANKPKSLLNNYEDNAITMHINDNKRHNKSIVVLSDTTPCPSEFEGMIIIDFVNQKFENAINQLIKHII